MNKEQEKEFDEFSKSWFPEGFASRLLIDDVREFIDNLLKEERDITIDIIRKKLPRKIKMIHAIKTKSDAGAGHTIGHNCLLKDFRKILKEVACG